MSKLNETEATIDILKSIILSLIVALFTMLRIAFINFEQLNITKKAILMVAIIVDALLLCVTGSFIYKKIKELRDL